MIDIRIGDVFDELAKIPDESVHCVVTSPPYWGLRDYGTAEWIGGESNCNHSAARGGSNAGIGNNGSARDSLAGISHCKLCGAQRKDRQIGLEPTLAEHITTMVRVFEELRRVLRKDGTCWLNYGDCYAGSSATGGTSSLEQGKRIGRMFNDKPTAELASKQLCMIPNRLAIALQDAGWWVRSEIIWHKPNPMPESVTDRPSTSHEKVFLLTKSQRYFYDADAVRERVAESQEGRIRNDYIGGKSWQQRGQHSKGGVYTTKPDKQRGHGRRHNGFNDRWDQMPKAEQQANGRNLRNVWTIATKPFSEAHFATFPPEIPETCIKAGCPKDGVVLDPFGGAGTTGLVADRLQRDAILIELNPEYAEMARKRIDEDRGGGLLDIMEQPEALSLL